MKHFATMYNGTMIGLFDEDSRNVDGEFTIETCETDADFEQWAQGDSFYCRFQNEVYVKLPNKNDDYETFTLTEANEHLGDPESPYYVE